MSYDRYKNKSDRFLDNQLDTSYEYEDYTYRAELSEEYIGMGDEFPMTKIHHYMTVRDEPGYITIPFSPYFHVSLEDFKMYVDMGCPSYSDIGGFNITSSEMLKELRHSLSVRRLMILLTSLRVTDLSEIRETLRNRYRLMSLNGKIIRYFPTI